ncbi:hypothetical protein [uncultured Aquimarina sp.]|uniref:hypothetical protein n=1 Tax=uncultured Aquimarina sp. TaxID=575652 RepID=UPI0026364D04|nr:hypothetical protein [uncultured Aquimarina sp.]
MKTIHNINKWSLIITLLLYLTIYLGLLAQIPLGFIQFVLALSILGHWKQLNSLSKKLILTYWSLFVSYWLAFAIMGNSLNDLWFIFYSIIPMSIASYFVYITYQIKKSTHEFKLDYI